MYDVGGGKRPHIGRELKSKLHLVVVGLDIDARELNMAPAHAYDEVICADITRYQGKGDADLVICQALLEHVRNVDQAIANIADILKQGGKAVIFVPSKNAVFARLNLLLPQEIKKRILYAIFPQSRAVGGFPSYYDRCTVRDFETIARRHGLEVEEKRLYFTSGYFTFFFPAYLIWRLWLMGFYFLAGEQAAETFSMALRKD